MDISPSHLKHRHLPQARQRLIIILDQKLSPATRRQWFLLSRECVRIDDIR